jgi:hypothetical protein
MQPQHRGGGGEGFLPPAPWPVIASPPVVPAWSAVANADRVVMRRGWAGAEAAPGRPTEDGVHCPPAGTQ